MLRHTASVFFYNLQRKAKKDNDAEYVKALDPIERSKLEDVRLPLPAVMDSKLSELMTSIQQDSFEYLESYRTKERSISELLYSTGRFTPITG